MRTPRLPAVAAFLAATVSADISGAEARLTILGFNDAHEAVAIADLVPALERWLKEFGDHPMSNARRPRIVMVSPGQMAAIHEDATTFGTTTRGAYDPETTTIYLQRPWSAENAYDRGVLLHELVHHHQVDTRHWYCPQAMEWDAYQLQHVFLAQSGMESGISWIAVALESSCARRDHHPD